MSDMVTLLVKVCDSFGLQLDVSTDAFVSMNAEDTADWRNYVPLHLSMLWPRLSTETRLALAMLANVVAEAAEALEVFG